VNNDPNRSNDIAPVLLCILDGFGFNPNPFGNAVALARKPNLDALLRTSPNSTLITFGERVGLPHGQMGNSEVGHMNIGAGRVMEQSLMRITRALARDELPQSSVYIDFIRSLAPTATLHLVGLFSDGGVHSHNEHLLLLLPRLLKDFAGEVRLHLITDGRDTGPQTGAALVEQLEIQLEQLPRIKIASVVGRFFAMDRDKRWDRIEKAYRAIACGVGACGDNEQTVSASAGIRASYAREVGDEFIEPFVVVHSPIEDGDGILFWNFREDRMREIVHALCDTHGASWNAFERQRAPIPASHCLCLTDYDHAFQLPYLFENQSTKNHLGEYISNLGLSQLRTAETEKYPHVTYFFNSGNEAPYPGEERVLVPSPRDVKTYDLRPEMSGPTVTDGVIAALNSGAHDLIVVNLANCDMVGHSGVISAAVRAVECVDTCVGRMLEALQRVNGRAIFIADHGNCEQLINYTDGTPHTAHTLFPVPIIVVGDPSVQSIAAGGALCDVAPTVLDLMGLAQPEEMTGRSLCVR